MLSTDLQKNTTNNAKRYTTSSHKGEDDSPYLAYMPFFILYAIRTQNEVQSGKNFIFTIERGPIKLLYANSAFQGVAINLPSITTKNFTRKEGNQRRHPKRVTRQKQ